MNLRRLAQSFKNAWRGLVYVYKNEQNFRIQILLSFLVIALLFIFGVRKEEAIVVFLLIILVLILEILNSAVEKFTDIVKPRLHEQVKLVKDILAAMVLFVSISTVIIGFFIFWPYFLDALLNW
jgi:diacylglycerol kinase